MILAYSLSLQSLRVARQLDREELTRLLQTDKPEAAAIIEAFDQVTERILFSAAGPCFILAAATIFLIAQLVAVKRRLDTAERDIRVLRDVVLGVDGIPLK